jgi:hypothetical protein
MLRLWSMHRCSVALCCVTPVLCIVLHAYMCMAWCALPALATFAEQAGLAVPLLPLAHVNEQ